ncbi:MAG: ATP-binding cassette domain-containing protein [Clostridia bacterium]|nr:ATP-binding cassette domain-containing protein [Clostridia bacterium]
MSNIITVTDAYKELGKRCVLDHVHVGFEEGKISGIIGRNGSGKTILLKAILGLLPLDKGEISVRGKVMGKEIEFMEDVGFIVNEPGFLPYESGRRNLRYIASIQNTVSDRAVDEAMEKVGLNPRDRKRVGQYSMGMRQRLGIAQAIMESPSVLILDEPMNGLDNDGVGDIRVLLMKMRKEGRTILLTSHSKEDVDLLCDTVYRMDRGVLTQER